MTILIAVFSFGYRGKMMQMSTVSEKHRTTIAHFLNHGRWDDTVLEQILKAQVVRVIYEEAERTGKPVICILDDTIASKTKPSSQAMHPIEAAYFHQSHLKKHCDSPVKEYLNPLVVFAYVLFFWDNVFIHSGIPGDPLVDGAGAGSHKLHLCDNFWRDHL